MHFILEGNNLKKKPFNITYKHIESVEKLLILYCLKLFFIPSTGNYSLTQPVPPVAGG